MRRLEYQDTAVEELEERVSALLSGGATRQPLWLRAPTGAGKTVICCELLSRLATARSMDDLEAPPPAFVWIAPNELHEQSYWRLKSRFDTTRQLRCIKLCDLEHNGSVYLEPRTVLFVNWQSINSKTNRSRQPNERGDSFDEVIRRTRDVHRIPLIVIIDEAHLFASAKQATQSREVLDMIQARVELRVSATPPAGQFDTGRDVDIARADVIKAQMIKTRIVVNPGLRDLGEGVGLRQYLLQEALKKCEELAKLYEVAGAKINPLLLIQLPNDSKALDAEDNKLLSELEGWLDYFGISRANGLLQVWLSNEKTPAVETDDIVQNDHNSKVLIFKQAIALGWDCPRAAVLLIYRKIESFTFGVQTVGRIMRMPEQRHYGALELNQGYVYTNLSHDYIQIAPDTADYLTELVSHRREGITLVELPTYFTSRGDYKNRIPLSGRFGVMLRAAFDEVVFKQNGKEYRVSDNLPSKDDLSTKDADVERNREEVSKTVFINWDIKQLDVTVVEDVELTGDRETIHVNKLLDYQLNQRELQQELRRWSLKQMGEVWDKRRSLDHLVYFLEHFLEVYFNVTYYEAPVLVLCRENVGVWTAVVKLALELELARLQERRRERERLAEKAPTPWGLPVDRGYSDDQYKARYDTPLHALQPYCEAKRQSNPEARFEQYLNAYSASIEWWYKNGDEGQEHFRIPYPFTAGGEAEQRLFYPDYVVRLRNGKVYIFDTKTAGSDRLGAAKNNALLEYLATLSGDYSGGILIEHNGVWYYPGHSIDDTEDITGWTAFLPTK